MSEHSKIRLQKVSIFFDSPIKFAIQSDFETDDTRQRVQVRDEERHDLVSGRKRRGIHSRDAHRTEMAKLVFETLLADTALRIDA